MNDAALRHRGGLNRHQPRELALRQHKAAHVLAQVARKAHELHRQIQPLQYPSCWPCPLGQACRIKFAKLFFKRGTAVKPKMLFGVLLNQRQLNAQRLAHITQGAARAVTGNRGGNGGAVMAVGVVDVLNDFFTALVFKVDINIGRLAALAADEALKQQVAFSRVNGGDAQAITNR